MNRLMILGFFCLVMLLGAASSSVQSGLAAQPTPARSIFIQSPREGQPLQGVEIIEGKIRGEGFISGKLSFTYAGLQEKTWFYIADVASDPDTGGVASFRVEWDTTQITDGDYHLRLKADFENRVAITEEIRHLRIRNYSLIETSTPAPQENGDGFPVLTASPLADPESTPILSNLENPASLDQGEMVQAVGKGLGVAVGLFLLGGIYAGIKNYFRRGA